MFYFKEASLGGRCLLLQALPAVVAEVGKKKLNRQPSGDDTRLLSCRVLMFAACGKAAFNNLQRIYQHMRHTQAHTHTFHTLASCCPAATVIYPPNEILKQLCVVSVSVLVYFQCGLALPLVFPLLKKNSLHTLFSYPTGNMSLTSYCNNFICLLFISVRLVLSKRSGRPLSPF